MKIPAVCGLVVLALSLPAQTIRVYVKDNVGVKPSDLWMATEKAAELLAPAGIHVEWRRREAGSLCSIAVHIIGDMPEGQHPKALAYAQAYEGVHITVLYVRVLSADPLWPQVTLGYVLAHEMTHLLQGISRHSPTGVMKANWTWADHIEMRRGRLALSPEDIDLIRMGMASRESRLLLAGSLSRLGDSH